MRRTNFILASAGALALTLTGGTAGAQTARAAGSLPPPSTANAPDRVFAQQAYSDNLAEVKLGRLAMQRGSTPEVRDLGRRMADDHSAALDALQRAAKQDGQPLTTRLDPLEQQKYDRLASLSGQAFDAAYVDQMRNAHEQAIELFRDEADRGARPALRAHARAELPTLQAHARVVQQTAQQLLEAPGAPASTAPGTQPGALPPIEQPSGGVMVHPTQQPAQPVPPPEP